MIILRPAAAGLRQTFWPKAKGPLQSKCHGKADRVGYKVGRQLPTQLGLSVESALCLKRTFIVLTTRRLSINSRFSAGCRLLSKTGIFVCNANPVLTDADGGL